MNKRTQKRYTSRLEILALIDEAIREAKCCKIAARAADSEASPIEGTPDLYTKWKNLVEERDRLMTKADRLETVKLKKLQNMLAEFDTQPMPVPGLDDEAVVMKPV